MFIYLNRRFAQDNFQATQITLIQHLNNDIFWALSAGHISNYNVQNLKMTRITTFRICNVVYQAGSRWEPGVFLIFYVFLKEHFVSLIT